MRQILGQQTLASGDHRRRDDPRIPKRELRFMSAALPCSFIR
jgi:hypothetical protein